MKRSQFIAVLFIMGLVSSKAMAYKKNTEFCLYAKKDLKSKCSVTPLNASFVTIVRQKKWAKVGLRDQNGTVGWVNIPQYQAALRELNQANVQSVYVTVNKSKDGKPEYNILAYRNGRPVSKAEAKKTV